jgi:hypothetical protein
VCTVKLRNDFSAPKLLPVRPRPCLRNVGISSDRKTIAAMGSGGAPLPTACGWRIHNYAAIGICATGPGRARHGADSAGLPGPIHLCEDLRIRHGQALGRVRYAFDSTPSSSIATIGNCASCAPGLAGGARLGLRSRVRVLFISSGTRHKARIPWASTKIPPGCVHAIICFA